MGGPKRSVEAAASSCTSTIPLLPPANTTCPNHQDGQVAAPLPLHPLHPLPLARRVQHRVRASCGAGPPQALRLIERLPSSPDAAASYSSSSSPSSSYYYAIERTIMVHPTSGVTVLLATPMIKEEEALLPHQGNQVVVTSGDPVVIKAAPRRRGPEHAPLLQPPAAGDDPWKEVAALQHLHHQCSSPPPRLPTKTTNDSSSSSSSRQQHPSPPSPPSCSSYSPHVVPLLDCLQDDEFIYMVLPYLSGGDLFSHVESNEGRGLSEVQAARFLRQAAEGLLFLKRAGGLAHHDVSLENIMLTSHQEDSLVQIIDLGMCVRVPLAEQAAAHQDDDAASHQLFPPVYYSMVEPQRCSGKPAYVAPEVVQERAYDPFAADIWSLGVCLYMMLTARPLYTSPHDQAFKILSRQGGARDVLGAYEAHGLCLSPLAKELVCSMLHASPWMRPTLEEVLRHPFLARRQKEDQKQREE